MIGYQLLMSAAEGSTSAAGGDNIFAENGNEDEEGKEQGEEDEVKQTEEQTEEQKETAKDAKAALVKEQREANASAREGIVDDDGQKKMVSHRNPVPGCGSANVCVSPVRPRVAKGAKSSLIKRRQTWT